MIISPADRLSSVSEYYFSRKLKEIKQLQKSGKNILNLGIGSPDLPPNETVVEALTKTALQESSHGYQSYVGIPALRQSIAHWLTESYLTEINENEILPLMGSKEGIMHIAMAFVNPGEKVLVPNPGYPTYRSVTDLVQGDMVEYLLSEKDNWSIDFEHLSSLPLDEVKLMWLNYPNMPTGARGNINQFERLIELAQKHKFLIVNDNPYSQLFEGSPLSIFQAKGAKEVCIELNSMSKSHNMAGWRVGWVTADAHYISTILKVKSNMDSGMFLGIQQAAINALKAPTTWYSNLRETYNRRRELGYRILSLLHCSFDNEQGGMFVWGKVPDEIDSVEVLIEDLIHKAEVFFAPGFIFGSSGERFIRISLCSPLEVLEQAETRIAEFQKNNI